MPRPQRRNFNQEFILFQPKQEVTPCGWAVAGRCSKQDGDRMVSAGSAVEECDAFGNLVAFRLLDRPMKVQNGAADAPPMAPMLTRREMDLIAGMSFPFGKSRTARMTELQRLARVHPLTRKALPPEDDVERAAEKFKIMARERLPLRVRIMDAAAIEAALPMAAY